jgi:uncharacterized protein (TIGR03435 family)
MSLASVLLMVAGVLWAQSDRPAPAFEVASVKPADPAARGVRMQFTPGGGVRFENASLAAMIQLAYDIQPFQLSGGPGWISAERFLVIAKAPAQADESQTRLRLQALLAERFQLSVHRDRKEAPVYALVAGRNGPKLKESTTGFDGITGSPGRLTGERAEMRLLVANLSRLLGRTVVDETGLKATYKFDLQWSPEMDGAAGKVAADKAEAVGASLPDSTTAPSLVSALQEQLGLRLEARKGSVEVIVVDRAERPAAN